MADGMKNPLARANWREYLAIHVIGGEMPDHRQEFQRSVSPSQQKGVAATHRSGAVRFATRDFS